MFAQPYFPKNFLEVYLSALVMSTGIAIVRIRELSSVVNHPILRWCDFQTGHLDAHVEDTSSGFLLKFFC